MIQAAAGPLLLPALAPQPMQGALPTSLLLQRMVTSSQTGSLKPVERLIDYPNLMATHASISPAPWPILTGVQPWLMSTRHWSTTARGGLCCGHQKVMWSLANGSSSTNSTQMALLLVTRLVGWFVALPSSTESTTMRLSLVVKPATI